ncbi:hypothetical protein [Flammeovirga pacifica]|uniref:DUF4595 domain-containing protein n=1 Tax=Flammeovirga pacifica TaxID=915059 RepID=A0A1S1YWL0_FLAPC|nr:hypothetical protein [Flammeovirga pacifica]OHX65392.1 hypothetical protein NH26_03030 [Flammeovirga pacifica]
MKIYKLLLSFFFFLFSFSCSLENDGLDDESSIPNQEVKQLLNYNNIQNNDERALNQLLISDEFGETLKNQRTTIQTKEGFELVKDGLTYTYTFTDYTDEWNNNYDGELVTLYNTEASKVNRIVKYNDLTINGNTYNGEKIIEGNQKQYFSEDLTQFTIERSETVNLIFGTIDFKDNNKITNREGRWGTETFIQYNVASQSFNWTVERAGVTAGVLNDNRSYNTQIITPLLLTSECEYSYNGIPLSGSIDYSFNVADEDLLANIDFGTECSREVTVKFSSSEESYNVNF